MRAAQYLKEPARSWARPTSDDASSSRCSAARRPRGRRRSYTARSTPQRIRLTPV